MEHLDMTRTAEKTYITYVFKQGECLPIFPKCYTCEGLVDFQKILLQKGSLETAKKSEDCVPAYSLGTCWGVLRQHA